MDRTLASEAGNARSIRAESTKKPPFYGRFFNIVYSAGSAGAALSFLNAHSLLLHLIAPLGAKTSGCLHSGQSSPVGFSHMAKSQSG